ncbi:hypothetical protein Tco_0221886 [Tanacetum coccineum]
MYQVSLKRHQHTPPSSHNHYNHSLLHHYCQLVHHHYQTEAKNPPSTLSDFASVFQFNNRVTALKHKVAELKKDPLHTQVTALVDEHLDAKLGVTKDEFMNFLSASLIARITEQVNIQLPHILLQEMSNFAPPEIQRMINESLEHVVLAKESSQPQSSYEAAATLTKFELKKILIDKIDKSESYLAAPEHRECYEGLIKSYDLYKRATRVNSFNLAPNTHTSHFRRRSGRIPATCRRPSSQTTAPSPPSLRHQHHRHHLKPTDPPTTSSPPYCRAPHYPLSPADTIATFIATITITSSSLSPRHHHRTTIFTLPPPPANATHHHLYPAATIRVPLVVLNITKGCVGFNGSTISRVGVFYASSYLLVHGLCELPFDHCITSHPGHVIGIGLLRFLDGSINEFYLVLRNKKFSIS